MYLHRLQYGYWGFRIDGGALLSYATREEAVQAWREIHGYDTFWKDFMTRYLSKN